MPRRPTTSATDIERIVITVLRRDDDVTVADSKYRGFKGDIISIDQVDADWAPPKLPWQPNGMTSLMLCTDMPKGFDQAGFDAMKEDLEQANRTDEKDVTTQQDRRLWGHRYDRMGKPFRERLYGDDGTGENGDYYLEQKWAQVRGSQIENKETKEYFGSSEPTVLPG